MGLANGIRRLNETGGIRGVEREHLVVTRNQQARAHGFCQLRGSSAIQISRHVALGCAAIDRQQSHINVEWPQAIRHALVD